MDDFHEYLVVFQTHMLKHADGDDLVEAPADPPVILMKDRNGQILTALPCEPDLFFRDVDGRYLAAVSLGCIAGKTAPAAADVQNMVTRLQIHFAADEVELFFLGFRQIVRPLKISATVLIVLV